MSTLNTLWNQSAGIMNMVSARELIRIMDDAGDCMVRRSTYELIEDVNGAPPPGGWTRRHLDVALDVVVAEIRDGMPSLWAPT